MESTRIGRANQLFELPQNDFFKSELMNKIIVEVYNGWPGSIGHERVTKIINLLSHRIPQYANIMGKSELETLEIIAKSRDVNYTNFFQESRIPDLSNVVFVFDTIQDFKAMFPSELYQCPCCGGISRSYSECDSGKIVNKKVCDWKVYGLLGDLGKGIRVIVKDMFDQIPTPIRMFKPVELVENEHSNQTTP